MPKNKKYLIEKTDDTRSIIECNFFPKRSDYKHVVKIDDDLDEDVIDAIDLLEESLEDGTTVKRVRRDESKISKIKTKKKKAKKRRLEEQLAKMNARSEALRSIENIDLDSLTSLEEVINFLKELKKALV